MKRLLLIFLPAAIGILTAFPAASQESSVSTVYFSIPSGGTGAEHQIFRQDIDGIPLRSEDTGKIWQLYQKTGNTWTKQSSQVSYGWPVSLYGSYRDTQEKGEEISFRWQQENGKADPVITIEDTGKSLVFKNSENDLATYRYALMPAPEGVSEIYGKSGFVHPLKTPAGNLVSRIQAPDHYHHYGLWQPWTRTEYRGEEIDFWNLNEEQGTVAFSDILSVTEGPLFSEITVSQNHITHPGRGEQTVLKEIVTYRVWTPPENSDYYLMDVIFHMNPVTKYPLTIKEYRYQGFSLRGPAHWNDNNARLLTSSGKNKTDGNGSRARWMKVTGPGNVSGTSTVIMMTNPANYNFPEQIRIWPTGMNDGKENVFINFNPAQDRDWTLQPGKTYTLQYRMILGDRDFSAEEIDQLWTLYAGEAQE